MSEPGAYTAPVADHAGQRDEVVAARVSETGVRPGPPRLQALWPGVLLMAPLAMVVGFGLRDGGFFPDTTAIGTLVALAVLLVRVTLDPRAFARLPWPGVVSIVALALLVAWTLLSSTWSGASSRAALEYGRVLLYAALALVFVSLGRSEGRARTFGLALAAGCAVIGILALGPWLLPGDFPLDPAFRRKRLNWPTSYWNATGLIAAFGAVLAVHLACSVRDHPVIRVLGAAVVPPLVATVVFSGSRGAVGAGVLGVAVLLLIGPSRGIVTGLPVVAVAAVWAAVQAGGVTGLDAVQPTAAALDEGRAAALVIGSLAGVAALVRAVLLVVDRRLQYVDVARVRRRHGWAAVAALAGLVVAVSIPLGAPGWISEGWKRFTSPESVGASEEALDRFSQLGNNGRMDIWEVAWKHGFRSAPFEGNGAGTFALLWQRERPTGLTVVDGHSLELEVMAELGIVGLLLLVAALLPMICALWWRALRDRAPAWAALAAVATAWAARSAVDWDWEMPAVTAWLFAAGGLALGPPVTARLGPRSPRRGLGPTLGLLGGLACIGLALMPIAILRSQDALVDGQRAFRAGRCDTAVQRSLTATQALPTRPEPFEILAWCDVRLDRPELAVRAARAAVRRDPDSWELRYTEALVLAVAGRDPRSAAWAALSRNPLDPRARDLVRRLASANRRDWRRIALQAALPIGS